LIPLTTPGRAFKSYLLILALIFSAAFLAGILAPSSIRQQLTEAFRVVANNYRGSAEIVGYSKAALKVLPHGVFELPALLIAASYGLWLGVTVFRRIRGKESILLRFHIEHAFRRYFAIVFPLLIIAAAIETALIVKLG
jgi:hypothetical protein